METITLHTESYLFQNSARQFRAFPFYELSNDEWIIFENDQPRYFLDFTRRSKPLVQDLKKRLETGEGMDEAIQKLSRFLGRAWTTHRNRVGVELPDSQQSETVTLTYLDDLADLFMDVYIVATDNLDTAILLNEDLFIKTYVTDFEGQGFESVYAENKDDLIRQLSFVFNRPIHLTELDSNNEREVYDLTAFKSYCITNEEVELRFKEWIEEGKTDHSMDQYGLLLSAVGYINNNLNRHYLMVVTEKRRHW